MPAIITHCLFGCDAFNGTSHLLGARSCDERDAYLLGSQGPDPLFYLVAEPRVDKGSRVGNLMHHARPAKLLHALACAVRALPERERRAARAWLAGFGCHYLLDRAEHPLVYFWQNSITGAGVEGLGESAGSYVHAEIERDIDEAILFSRRGVTIAEFSPADEALAASDELLAIIDRVVFDAVLATYGRVIDGHAYSRAVKSFRRIQRLFWSPKGTALRVLGGIERRVTGNAYSFYRAMAHRARRDATSAFANDEHRVWENPFTHERSDASFADLFDAALAQVPEMMGILVAEEPDAEEIARFCADLNFSGAPVDPDDLGEE